MISMEELQRGKLAVRTKASVTADGLEAAAGPHPFLLRCSSTPALSASTLAYLDGLLGPGLHS